MLVEKGGGCLKAFASQLQTINIKNHSGEPRKGSAISSLLSNHIIRAMSSNTWCLWCEIPLKLMRQKGYIGMDKLLALNARVDPLLASYMTQSEGPVHKRWETWSYRSQWRDVTFCIPIEQWTHAEKLILSLIHFHFTVSHYHFSDFVQGWRRECLTRLCRKSAWGFYVCPGGRGWGVHEGDCRCLSLRSHDTFECGWMRHECVSSYEC